MTGIIQKSLIVLLFITCSVSWSAPTNMRQYRAQEQFYILAYAYGLSPQPKKVEAWKGWDRDQLVSLMVPELFSNSRNTFNLDAHLLGYANYLESQASWVQYLGTGSLLIRSDYEDTRISFVDGKITAVETLCEDGSVTSHITYRDGRMSELAFSWSGRAGSMKSTPVYTLLYHSETGKLHKVEKRINGMLDYWTVYTHAGEKLVSTISYKKGQPFYRNFHHYTGSRLDSTYTINQYDDTTATRFTYNYKGVLASYTYGDLKNKEMKRVTYKWAGKKIASYTLEELYRGEVEQQSRTEFTYKDGRLTEELWVVQDGDQFEIIPTTHEYDNGNLIRTGKHIALDVTYDTLTVGERTVVVPLTAREQGQDFEFEWEVK